jgi:hypothetical protein
MFLQHVRTRLDRQRNYFRIYMISHALISDSVYGRPHSGCTDTRLNGRRNYFRIGAESSRHPVLLISESDPVYRDLREERAHVRALSRVDCRAQNAGVNMHAFYKVLGRAPSTRMFIPFPHNVLGRAPSTRMFIPFPHKVLGRAPSTRMFIPFPHKVLGRAPSTRMFIPFPHNVLGRAPSTRMFIPFPHKVLGRAPSTRMFMPHNPSTHVDTAPAVCTCAATANGTGGRGGLCPGHIAQGV